ncbi:MAG: SufE family protein [Alphaproteobacteria bacterium]|jgi:cysteine desulfuration protein SufE|nr:SufE family protein [Alphaproteobacteria bacterium]
MNYEQIKKILDSLDDPVQKLEYVMEVGKSLPTPPAGVQCSEIVGCTSFVQICRDGNKFYGTADSELVRGILTIILSIVDGKTSDEIRELDLFTAFADLKINIGAARLNGVNSMIRFLKNL